MVSLTFYGGINEIGGNKILIEDKKTRIFLDFGQSFSLLDDYFVEESFLKPRDRFGLKDYFEFGLIPQLEGLYCDEAVERTGLDCGEPKFDAVLISHAHFDHVAHLTYLHSQIPVYLGEATKRILDSTAVTTRQQLFGEDSDIRTFRSNKEISIGDLEITPIHVDHSVPGAYGFLVETSEGTIVYTGDLRQHGPRADMTKEFIEKAKATEPEALIIEGTRVTKEEKRKNHTEKFVHDESKKVAESKGFLLAMRYPKDLDRFQTFYGIAKETGRKLVISMKTAHLLLSLKDDPHVKLPDPLSDKNIEIYCREMKVYKDWEKQLMPHCIGSADVKDGQAERILELDFWQLTELIDIRPRGGDCVHSMSEPFEEDPISQVSDEVLKNWLAHFGMNWHQLHASGHASKSEVFDMIKEINVKKVIPVHTKEAELFPRGLIIEKGQKVNL